MAGSLFTTLLNTHLDTLKSAHRLPLYQLKTLDAWRRCRTASMGSHSQYCENGHLMNVWYDSCKRRGCQQCQSLSTKRWLDKQSDMLLRTTHHHWIFTLPHELLPLWRYNRLILQNALFGAAADTLKLLSQDSRYLGAQPAFSLTLHTWGRNLSLHPHLHCLIAHGGLTSDGAWRKPNKSCLFPAQVMMQIFRGKFLAALRKEAALVLPNDLQARQLSALFNKLGRKSWVVHCRKPYTHGRGILSYLSRYVKRGPISPRQLSLAQNGKLQFHYTSHQTKKREKQTVAPEAFIYRLCEHMPLPNRATMRYYGIYHSCKRNSMNKAREQLGQSRLAPKKPIKWESYLAELEVSPLCKDCGAGIQLKQRDKKIA